MNETRLDFSKNIEKKWTLWGNQFSFQFPTPDNEIRTMDDSLGRRPGDEPWGFYESVTQLDNNKNIYLVDGDADEDQLSINEIAEYSQSHPLHFARRRFNHAWMLEYGSCRESIWCDIWIHRNDQSDNLYNPASLQAAHMDFLKSHFDSENLSDDEDLFDLQQNMPDWIGLNWHWEKGANYYWQSYMEINGNASSSFLFGQNFLIPLSEHHYCRIRFYRLNASDYDLAQQEFSKLITFVFQHLEFTPQNTQAMQALSNTEDIDDLPEIPAQNYLSAESWKTWNILNQQLRTGNYQQHHIPLPDLTPFIKSRFERYIPLMIVSVVIIIFICFGYGGFYMYQWLKANPESPMNWLARIYFGASIIFFMKDYLKRNFVKD